MSFHPEDAMPRAVTIVEQMLQRAGASSVSVTGSKIIFTVGFIRFRLNRFRSYWNILNMYDWGEVKIEANASGIAVRYHLSTFRSLSIVTAFVVAALIFALAQTAWPQLVALSVLGWLWFFASNALLGWFRFRNWLADGIRRKLREDRENWVSAPVPAMVRITTTAAFVMLFFTGLCVAIYFILFPKG